MKFFSKPVSEHAEVPLADAGRWEEVVSHWQHRETPVERRVSNGKNACYVVSVQVDNAPSQLAEILSLVKAQGDTIVGYEVVRLLQPEPRTFIGKGRSREVAARAKACGADLLVIDAELKPSQMRNLEDHSGIAICDREAVILNVFLRHAKTRQARIQVEIAHMEYLRPRIRGLGLDMDQQASSVMTGRGPGETVSELMARQLDDRLNKLRKALAKIQGAGIAQRKRRSPCHRVALVGYTNAGKTSLMNGLTASALSARDRPFETLDTTTRCLSRDGTDILISDTVGFIRRLPHRLLASFESTLAEINETDLLVVVVDYADPEKSLHLQTTESLLDKLGAGDIARLYVFNKIDRVTSTLSESECSKLSKGHPFTLLSCRHNGQVKYFKQLLMTLVQKELQVCRLFVPYSANGLIKDIYARCRVLTSEAKPRGLRLTLKGARHVMEQLKRRCREVSNA